jgi:TRAP transporter 4TM/12TM fusion protein
MRLDLSHRGIVRVAAAAIAISMAAWHMWVIWVGPPEAHLFRAAHLLFAITLVFLWFRRTSLTEDELAMMSEEERRRAIERAGAPSLLDYLLLALSAAALLYVLLNYDYLVNRIYYVDDLSGVDMILGVLLIVMIIEGTRRLMGWALPLTAIAFLAYGLFAARVEPMRLLDQLYMTTEGIFGMPLGVSAAYVMIFVLFGSFMERTGTGQLFMDFAMSLTGHTAGGPGKVSVVSSSLFGTISGSAVANVMVDGPISIPLMKRSGFPPHFAAGVEATASTGGQIMPPIMGAAAFVMAEFLGVGYGQVVIWAIIPAVLYYVACFGAVHFEAKRRGLLGVPRAELPVLSVVLKERGHLFIPVVTILAVMYSGYSAPMAALAGTLLCFPAAWLGPAVLFILPALMLAPVVAPGLMPAVVPSLAGLHPALEAAIVAAIVALWVWSTHGRIAHLPFRLADIAEAMIEGARNALSVALACACAGIIIGIVTLTGLGISFTQLVVGLAQNTLLLALILTMLAGIVLGMGIPTTPAYIIMAALLIPALVKLGVNKPAAHMFAFYFAILSAITPPVALAVYAASGLAKSDIWKTGWAAMRIGAAGFIVPFLFVYEPALLMLDPALIGKSKDLVTAGPLQILQSSITAGIGCLLLAAGLHGYLLAPAPLWQRAGLVAAALMLVWPSLIADIAGAALTGLVVVAQLATRRGEQPSPQRPIP